MNSRNGKSSFTVLAAPDAGTGALATGGASVGIDALARAFPGGGAVGTGIGCDAIGDAFAARDEPVFRLASRVAFFDFGPRTGVRATKTQPT